MQDGIIAGNGNSRYLKTVSAALSLYPTYQDFMAAVIAGTFPIDLNGINIAGWTQQGTALNKANLLKDATAALYGLGTDAVPDDVLALLATKNIQVEYTEITESTNWTAPENLASNTAFALLVGGGGGGYGGGGGSGYVTLSQVSLTPGQSYQAVIGAGGNGYFTSSSPQTDGGTEL